MPGVFLETSKCLPESRDGQVFDVRHAARGYGLVGRLTAGARLRPPVSMRREWQASRMEKHALVEGRQYGYREKSTLGTPFLKVTLIEKVAGRPKVKIRFEDGP